jgi:hypothetical protein
VAVLGAELAVAQAPSAEIRSQAEDRKAVAVTIYNDALALIREERDVQLGKGRNSLALRDVSAQIKAETATLKSLSGGNLTLLEQNYDFDLLTPDKLLEKYVGRKVTVIRDNPQTGAEIREEATVLSAQKGVVLRYADRIETSLPANYHLAYPDVPATLRDRPTLVVELESDKAGAQRVELAYLTSGLSWRADYVAGLSQDEKTLDVDGWVTLHNRSGTAYQNARLQLVAGDVNRAAAPSSGNAFAESAVMRMKVPAPMAREELFEYHMYTLARPTTLRDQQTKQVALLGAEKIPVNKEYRLAGEPRWYFFDDSNRQAELGDKRNVEVFISFDNRKPLGQPLPKGIVRVYKKDSRGQPVFVGEDDIEHIPENETVRLKLGKAFDITGTWKRTDFARISSKVIEQEITIELKNAKEIPVTVKVVEPVFGAWKIVNESHPHQKAEASHALWNIEVAAKGRTELKYRVRSK